MSDLSVNSILDAIGGATTTINGFTPTVSNMAGRNRIINGNMAIDQRNAGAVVSVNGEYPVDRFKIAISGSATATAQQSTTIPAGFTNSLVYTIGTGVAQGSSSVYRILQVIEGFNTADLGWGVSGAQAVTVSFWVRSSVTGTFSGALLESTGGTASYVFNFSIVATNTWEYKTVTIAGPTVGTWQTTNSGSILLMIDLGSGTNYEQAAGSWSTSANKFRSSGSVVLSATSGATFYITGVQLEAGSVATPFEHRQYGQELALCMRYYEKSYNIDVAPATNTYVGVVIQDVPAGYGRCTYLFSTSKRAPPTSTVYSRSGTAGQITKDDAIGTSAGIAAGMSRFSVNTVAPQGAAFISVFHWTADAEL
jgi:hypothetical protein